MSDPDSSPPKTIARMPVREATERMRIAADGFYVIPPNRALTLTGGLLHLTAPEKPRGLRRRIDELVESIALELQELELLFKALLIGVTGFFRDRPVQPAVKDDVLPTLLATRSDG